MYDLDTVLKDILHKEELLPMLDYDSFKDKRFYILYSQIFHKKLSSNIGYKEFHQRCQIYFYIARHPFNPVLWLLLLKDKLYQYRQSLKYKRIKSIITGKKVKVKENNWTV